MKFLKNHPFAVEAYFENSLVLTFAVPREQVADMIPECLELDVFQDKWAFIAVALVKTKSLRPKGFPRFMGNDFFLIGYRIFVRYTNKAGKRRRGLYIIKSETDKKRMEFLGNIFTHYQYTTTDISDSTDGNLRTVTSKKSDIELVIDQTEGDIRIPVGSPFTDWREARKFAGPLPYTFTYNEADKTVLIIEGVRENWTPKPVKVKKYHVDFLNSLPIQTVVLASAFEISDVPYHWKKGKIERWN